MTSTDSTLYDDPLCVCGHLRSAHSEEPDYECNIALCDCEGFTYRPTEPLPPPTLHARLVGLFGEHRWNESPACCTCGEGSTDVNYDMDAHTEHLAPSPCPNGCRMCDWYKPAEYSPLAGVGQGGEVIPFEGICLHCAELERVRSQRDDQWRLALGYIPHGARTISDESCYVAVEQSPELERVRKAAEDACCTIIDADHLATPPSVGHFLSFEEAFSAGICFAANHLSKTVDSTGALNLFVERVRKLERASALRDAAKIAWEYYKPGNGDVQFAASAICNRIRSLIPAEDQAAPSEHDRKVRLDTLSEVFARWDQNGVEPGDIWDWLIDGTTGHELPYPPPRIDGDVLTYAGFRWQRLPVPTVEGETK